MGFKALEGDYAIVVSGGVFKQCDLYVWDGKLFAGIGAGKVRLKADGSTSKDGMRFEYLAYEGDLYRDRFGRLTVENGEGYVQLIAQPDGRLEPMKLENKSGT